MTTTPQFTLSNNTKHALTAIASILICLSAMFGYAPNLVQSYFQTQVGSTCYGLQKDYSYVITHPLGDLTKAAMQNGTTGAFQYWSTNASKVINFAIGNLTVGRTYSQTVFIKDSFTLTNPIIMVNNTCVEGTSQAGVYTSAPQLTVQAGASMMAVFENGTGHKFVDLTVENLQIDCNKGNGATAGGINFTSSQWGNCIIKDVKIANAKRTGIILTFFSVVMSHVTLLWVSNKGVYLNSCTDCFIDHVTTSGVDLADFSLLGIGNALSDCYFGGGANSSAPAQFFVQGGEDRICNVIVDYTLTTGFEMYLSGNNTIVNLTVSSAQAASKDAILINHSNFTTITNFHVLKGGGTNNWNYGIHENTCKYNTYSDGMVADITNNNLTATTSRIYHCLFGTTRINDP